MKKTLQELYIENQTVEMRKLARIKARYAANEARLNKIRALTSPLDGATRQQERQMRRAYEKGVLTRQRNGSLRYMLHA